MAAFEDRRPVVLVLGDRSLELARRVAAALGGAELWAPASVECDPERRFERAADAIREAFAAGHPVIGLCAAGILVRSVAPLLARKQDEPPVVAVAEDGRAVVPLLGGHRGANALARRIGAALGVPPALTTASEARFGAALDELPRGWRLADPGPVPAFTTALLEGESARLTAEAGDATWLTATALPLAETGTRELLVTCRRVEPSPARLVLHPPALAIGVGCARGVAGLVLAQHVERVLADAGLSAAAVACVVSVDLKADEPAVQALAATLRVPARFFSPERLLAETGRLTSRSAATFAATGCWGVAEGAALAAAGEGGRLLVPKRIGAGVTCAVAQSPSEIDPAHVGQAQGTLLLVGLGPGDPVTRTPAAAAAVGRAEHVVGYGLYLDLAADLLRAQVQHRFALGEEELRCRKALDLAAGGACVALLASGDPGIYAMGALVLELIERAAVPAWSRIRIEFVPGVSAMQAAAAVVGAPLGHDFCAISLSDLLTPWPVIEQRLDAAGRGDFVVALYNPVSAQRRAGLERARDILLRHRPPTTPAVVASRLGRAGARTEVLTLAELTSADADMLTTLVIGSTATRRFAAGNGTTRVYTPRGYRGS